MLFLIYTLSKPLYYKGCREEKIYSSIVAKFGPNVIHDSVSSASHTVIMEHYIALIECCSVCWCLCVCFLFDLMESFTWTTATKINAFTLVAVFIQNYKNCLYFTVCVAWFFSSLTFLNMHDLVINLFIWRDLELK